jgi:hypothetical protein
MSETCFGGDTSHLVAEFIGLATLLPTVIGKWPFSMAVLGANTAFQPRRFILSLGAVGCKRP